LKIGTAAWQAAATHGNTHGAADQQSPLQGDVRQMRIGKTPFPFPEALATCESPSPYTKFRDETMPLQ
jgi:hypothetical protein